MSDITIYEFDWIQPELTCAERRHGVHYVPSSVFSWLKLQCLKTAESGDTAWLRLSQKFGKESVQVTSYVGVIRAPGGSQIEVLPKIGRVTDTNSTDTAKKRLIEMLSCLGGFRHIKTDSAKLKAAKMPLLEIFISEFLESVNHVVKRGLRSTYTHKEENLFALRGKLMMAQHLRQNMFRKDRFYTHHDEFSNNRPENRLLHSALVDVMLISSSQTNQQLARELQFVFADVPTSTHYGQDFNQVLLDRGMGHYSDAISWARLILVGQSPLTGSGTNLSTSLLFPMEAVFEAFVGKHLAKQLTPNFHLKKQSRRFSLVQHLEKSWFWLKPDFLVCSRTDSGQKLVLDAKWKLIDSNQANGTKKYGLSQTDFYQLYAYGQSYLNGEGDLVLIYPKTERFKEALEVFFFSPSMDTKKLRLWVLPFCLSERKLILPKAESCPEILTSSFAAIEGDRTMRVPN